MPEEPPPPVESPCPACGEHHHDPGTRLVIGGDIIGPLLALLDERRWSRVVLVSDANTDRVLADAVAARLTAAGHSVERSSFPDRHGLLADASAVQRLRAVIAAGRPHVAVVTGSGTLNDITRYSTFAEATPYVSLPTAASMDGYASAVAAMQFGGLKATFPAHAPVAILADLEVVAGAPREMTSWGLGDLLGKATARFDWLLGQAVTGEVYCPLVEDRVLAPLEECAERAGELLAGDEAGVEVLMRGLVESGIAMAMIGSSRPASGSEHHLSHFWDLLAYRELRPHAPHGLQVAYATRAMMELQRRVLDHLGDPMTVPIGGEPGDEERAWLGSQSESELIQAVRADKRAIFDRHAAGWPPDAATLAAARTRLAAAVTGFAQVSGALDAARVPPSTGFVDVDAAMLGATLRFANRVRSRFTTLDLLEAQGHLAPAADALVDAWS
jgi:glycerol-1-phosphate dehydrogenase [NAD(P)+]